MEEQNFSNLRNDILTAIENYLKESKQSYLFKASKPTRKWYYGFMRKYGKNICERKTSSMQAVRAVSSQPQLLMVYPR